MPQLFGLVQRLEPSPTLWLLAFLPLLGALTNALAGFVPQLRHPNAVKRLRMTSLGAVLGTFALSIWHIAKLVPLPEAGRHLYWHGWQMVRIGSVSFDFGLALEQPSAVMALVITMVGLLVHLGVMSRKGNDTSTFRLFTCLHLAIASMLLLALADGFIPMLFGWQGIGLTCLLLAHSQSHSIGSGTRAFVFHRIGDFGLLAGMLVIFWGLGGRWLADGIYQPDLHPRFVAVSAHAKTDSEPSSMAHASTGHDATLTFTALPGAEVHLNNAPLGTSPLVRESIQAGRHSVRIAPGKAQEEHEVNWFLTPKGSDTTIAHLGPTLVFREIRDQLALHDENGRHLVLDALSSKRLFGMSIVTLACLFFCLPIVAQAGQLPLRALTRRSTETSLSTGPLLHAGLLVAAVGVLVSRLWFLFSSTNVAGELIAGALVVSMLLLPMLFRAENTARASQ